MDILAIYFLEKDFFFPELNRLDYSFVRSHAFNRTFCMDFFNKIHDMNREKLWILGDPNVSEKYEAAAAAG